MNPILQSEASECSVACLAMVATYHGYQTDLIELRSKFPLSLKGATLESLMNYASRIGFSGRPLALDMPELKELQLPCILHWDLNHFVVLKKVHRKGVTILDPAVGERRLSMEDVSKHFTGVALELSPNADFKEKKAEKRVSLSSLTGRATGLWTSMIQIFLVAITLEAFTIVAPLLNQVVVDDVLSGGNHELLTVLVLGFGLLLLIQTAIGFVRSWMIMILGQTLSLQWIGNVFIHLIKLPTAFFEKRHLGDITSRMGSVGAIQRTLTTSAISAVLDGIMAVAALAMMLMYSATLTAVVVISVVLYGLLRWAYYRPFRDAAAERLVISAKEQSHLLETLRAITPIKLYGREELRRSRWQNLTVEVQNRDIQTAKMNIGFSAASTLISGAENLIVMWLGAKMILSSQMAGVSGLTVGMLFAFMSYKGQFSNRLISLIGFAVDIKMLNLHTERLADIVLEEPEKDDKPENSLDHLQPVIELRNVSFRYSEGEPWILKDANLIIPPGQSIAITGASGAGKTTMLKVALGLLQPSEGDVLYGGTPIRQLGISNYRKLIGTVMQEDVLLSGTLSDNISFFDSKVDQERVVACAMLAELNDEIRAMPMGYHTLVGDLGTGLSGGQKQRLLLARALYKKPRILALDEATSNLDIRNERVITQTLAKMKMTRFIIAHRPETIAGASRVVQLKGGKIVEVAELAKQEQTVWRE